MIDHPISQDVQLITLLIRGDRVAYTTIYNKYWAEMYSHAYRMLKDQELAKDVVQDVFSQLWLKAAQLNPNSKLSGMLYLAIRNKIFNLIAHNKVQQHYLSSIAAFMEQSESSTNLLDEKEILATVEREIANLPPKMRLVFELSRKQNLSHKEIAEKLNISDQTVKKQIQNALKILKPKLGHLGLNIAVLIFCR